MSNRGSNANSAKHLLMHHVVPDYPKFRTENDSGENFIQVNITLIWTPNIKVYYKIFQAENVSGKYLVQDDKTFPRTLNITV